MAHKRIQNINIERIIIKNCEAKKYNNPEKILLDGFNSSFYQMAKSVKLNQVILNNCQRYSAKNKLKKRRDPKADGLHRKPEGVMKNNKKTATSQTQTVW